MPIIKKAVNAESNKNPILGPDRLHESTGVFGDVFNVGFILQSGEVGGVNAESKVKGVTGLLKVKSISYSQS